MVMGWIQGGTLRINASLAFAWSGYCPALSIHEARHSVRFIQATHLLTPLDTRFQVFGPSLARSD